MNLARRSPAFAEPQSQHRPHARGVAGWSSQTHAQSRPGRRVAEQSCLAAILRDRQIDPAILIEVGQRGAALFAIHLHTRFTGWHSPEPFAPVTAQPKSPARVQSADCA